MRPSIKTGSAVILGILLGAAATALFMFNQDRGELSAGATVQDSAGQQPLYWVAPMDANFRRDEPGKSPMGMDLVPVYATSGEGTDEGPGTIEDNEEGSSSVAPGLKWPL